MYKKLIEYVKGGSVSFKYVKTFNMDEYVGKSMWIQYNFIASCQLHGECFAVPGALITHSVIHSNHKTSLNYYNSK